jgi:glycosyltransferase involved in cell wall biosynthesis
VDDQAVSGHLIAADMVALPFRDGVSFRRGSLMAALAHGCAIITTHPQMDVPELISDDQVRMIPAESPTALSIAIEDLAYNPELREDLGRHARDLAQQFTWENIAVQTAAYFEELLDQPS